MNDRENKYDDDDDDDDDCSPQRDWMKIWRRYMLAMRNYGLWTFFRSANIENDAQIRLSLTIFDDDYNREVF